MSRRLVIRANAVVAEIIDGEAVIMHLKTGHYFSTRGTGADLWSLIEQGMTERQSAAAIASAVGLSAQDVASAVRAFGDELVRHELADAVEEEPSKWLGLTPRVDSPWTTPTLEVFTDMEDLLLLDPIHDVAEVGWPMQKGAGEQG